MLQPAALSSSLGGRWLPEITTRWAGAIVLAVATIATTLPLLLAPGAQITEGTDYAAFYDPVGRSIAAGRGPVLDDGTPATRYPPGYPAIVGSIVALSSASGIGESTAFAAVAMIAMALSAWLLWWAVVPFWGPQAAMVAGLAWATYPAAVWLSIQRGTELPFAAVFFASVALVVRGLATARSRPGAALAAGVLLGMAMLIRPIAVAAWLPLSIAILRHRALPLGHRWWKVAILLAGISLVVVPWEAWVYARSGRVILLSDGGAPSIRDGLTYALSHKVYREGAAVPQAVREVMQGLRDRYETLESTAAIRQALMDQWERRPLAVIQLFALKAIRSWYATDSNANEKLLALVQIAYLSTIALATVRAWRLAGAYRQLAIALWVMTAYFWAMTTVVLSILRYMVPAMGLLFLLLPALLANPPKATEARA